VQRIHLSTGATFLTGDRIASSLLHYAKALGQTAELDVVEVPTRREDGSAGRTTLLMGPASQLSAEWIVAEIDETIDETLVASLGLKTAHLLAPHAPDMETAGFLSLALDDLDL
jgi:hypothetical protein